MFDKGRSHTLYSTVEKKDKAYKGEHSWKCYPLTTVSGMNKILPRILNNMHVQNQYKLSYSTCLLTDFFFQTSIPNNVIY